jgi:hypothetical protein
MSSPKDIEARIDQQRDHLAATIDELVYRAKPQQIARRSAQDAKQTFDRATRTPEGGWRLERIAAVVVAAVAVVGVLVVGHRRSTS